jgi:hypothetical protein
MVEGGSFASVLVVSVVDDLPSSPRRASDDRKMKDRAGRLFGQQKIHS